MSREDLFAARIEADATIMALLPGGVHKSSELGREGITRTTAATAYDANGYLEVAALVRERAEVPDGIVRDPMVQLTSTIQIVETWFYADSNHAALEPVKDRAYVLFEGWPIDDGFEVFLVNIVRDRDRGALNGAALIRMDWQVNSILGG